ncbi:TadE/TadG family type IV pilus assembly protein [Nocardioides sp.]|uniref:TadE/TadG family type IV pilus assembly protein n=1 Tax=Nocardioides sp. TaxID=35761 RepID=UPI002737244B|nr:hypothetical protein [Nocardioides sp.]MDP3889923.1 hypothetical protein [Nocardioides sp.]
MGRILAAWRRRRSERGTMLVEFTWLGILLLIPLVYILISVFEVQRGAFAVTAASRAAGRAYSIAPTMEEGGQRARAAARLALEDQGLPGDTFALDLSCRPQPGECLAPGSVITVTITSRVDLPLMPRVLGGDKPSIKVESTHSVPRGKYRSH